MQNYRSNFNLQKNMMINLKQNLTQQKWLYLNMQELVWKVEKRGKQTWAVLNLITPISDNKSELERCKNGMKLSFFSWYYTWFRAGSFFKKGDS